MLLDGLRLDDPGAGVADLQGGGELGPVRLGVQTEGIEPWPDLLRCPHQLLTQEQDPAEPLTRG